MANGSFFDTGKIAAEWLTDWAPIVRVAHTFDDEGTPVGYANFPLGNVADPESPHFSDMQKDWVEGSRHRLPFAREEVLAASSSPRSLTRQSPGPTR